MKKIWLLSLALPLLLIPACGDTAEDPPPAEPSEDIAGPPPEGADDGTGGKNTQ
jgi:hypothetical protein